MNPIDQIRHLFKTGYWLNTYELPFFNNTYLQATGLNNWITGDMEKVMGKGNAITNFTKGGLKLNFPTQPEYVLQNIGDCGYDSGSLGISFYLINQNDRWLDKNFRFLHAFYGGTQWMQYQYGFIKGSNVYNIVCPGRFQILWASVRKYNYT